jgi:hypothetical protein
MRGLEPLASYMRINSATLMKSSFFRQHGRSHVAECCCRLQKVAGVRSELPYNCRTLELPGFNASEPFLVSLGAGSKVLV